MLVRILVAAGMLLFQMQGPTDGDTPEPGKPTSCDNFHNTKPDMRCKCGRAMHSKCDEPVPNVEMDHQCKTFCRVQNCKCLSQCTT